MTWTKLAPIAKTSGRPMASASVVVNKDQVAKISLILSASLKDDFEAHSRCDVLAGGGEHADCLMLEFRPEGAFELRNFVHGGARIMLPVPDGWPARAAANAPCAIVSKRGGVDDQAPLPCGEVPHVALRMPIAEWTRVAPAANPPPRAATAGPTEAAPKVGNGELVDVVEYLAKKGVKVARLAGERFMMAGQTVTMGAVLKAVNEARDEAGLTPLARSQVR